MAQIEAGSFLTMCPDLGLMRAEALVAELSVMEWRDRIASGGLRTRLTPERARGRRSLRWRSTYSRVGLLATARPSMLRRPR